MVFCWSIKAKAKAKAKARARARARARGCGRGGRRARLGIRIVGTSASALRSPMPGVDEDSTRHCRRNRHYSANTTAIAISRSCCCLDKATPSSGLLGVADTPASVWYPLEHRRVSLARADASRALRIALSKQHAHDARYIWHALHHPGSQDLLIYPIHPSILPRTQKPWHRTDSECSIQGSRRTRPYLT